MGEESLFLVFTFCYSVGALVRMPTITGKVLPGLTAPHVPLVVRPKSKQRSPLRQQGQCRPRASTQEPPAASTKSGPFSQVVEGDDDDWFFTESGQKDWVSEQSQGEL